MGYAEDLDVAAYLCLLKGYVVNLASCFCVTKGLCPRIMVMLATPFHGHVYGLNCNMNMMMMLVNPCREKCMGSTATW